MEIQYQPAVKIGGFQDVFLQRSYMVSEGASRKRTEDYSIVPITEKDSERMIVFLRRFFFKDEPLNVAVNLLATPDDRCVELEEYSLGSVPEGLSLMAVSSSGELIGVCLNGGGEPGHLEDMQVNAEQCPNPKFKKILHLLTTVEREADVYNKFPEVKKVLEVRIISVDDSWRGRGIATALINKTRDLARQQDFPLIRVDCTSHYSAMAVARLGMECILTIKYEEYKGDGDREPVFKTAPPHAAVTTYIQRM